MAEQHFSGAIARILRPLVRAMIGRGLTFPVLSDLLKRLYVDEATGGFGIPGRRMTDSRISVLTGLQRRDIRSLRDLPADPAPRGHGPLPRVLALWQGDRRFLDETGAPRILPRSAETGESFETLVAEIGRDVHPRTLLDELCRLGLVDLDAETDRVRLVEDSLVPSRDAALLTGYYAANLGDHAEAAATNLLAAPAPGPFFERAVHYNRLSPRSVEALEQMARARLLALLQDLNAEALARQRLDRGDTGATGRIRIGAFVYHDAGRDGGGAT